jgi:hypothetical protein
LGKSPAQVQDLGQSRKITFQLIVIQRKGVKRTRRMAHEMAVSEHGGVPL